MTDRLLERVVAAIGDGHQVESEIGRGGMGVVYRGRDMRLRRPVAIKVLPPDLAFRDDIRTRFLREAQTSAQLSHPNIVPIYGVDERDGLVFFIMALVEGESLAQRLAAEPRPPVAFVTRVLREVADALAYAHQRGIIHRDIKPDNILLDRATGRPLVTDFGIARAAEGDSRLTVTGVAVGTPAYMSPEQAIGERDIDGRSDIYSLAVVGYQMLVGELPFSASNTPSMLMKVISETPRAIGDVRRDVPAPLVRAVERAMAKKADDRWPNAARFRDALSDPTPAGAEGEASDPRGSAVRARGMRAVPRPLMAPQSRSGTRAPDDSARRAPGTMLPPWPAPAPPAPPGVPPVPAWMPSSWREARRGWSDDAGAGAGPLEQNQRRRGGRGRGKASNSEESFAALPLLQRIRAFRRKSATTAVTVGSLATINLLTVPEFWWFLFPTTFMTIALLHRGASLWADGVRLRDVFGRNARIVRPESLDEGSAIPSARELAANLAPADVLRGPFGESVRRAAEDRAVITGVIGKLSKADKELIPDVQPTVDALVERVASLAQAMHRLDEDVRPDALAEVDARIAAVERESAAEPDRAHKLSLLQRQRSTLDDLLKRRATLASQLESAVLMLQNIKLDLLALRNAGVQSSIDDVSSATQEARALSRDIGHVLDAAKQIRN